jgi:hypothetical protein
MNLGRVAGLSAIEIAGSPVDFGKLIADDVEKWANVIRVPIIKPQQD